MYYSGWRWIFIIEGIATIVAGMVAPIFLVEFPERTTFLSPRQKQIALQRVKIDKTSQEIVHPTMKQTLVLLCDWKLALFGIQYFIAASSVYSLAFFKPIILRQGMGFSYAKAQLLSSPPYVFAVFASLAMAYVSDKIRMRWPIMCTQAVIGIIGLLVILYAKLPGVRYFGLYLAIYGCQANIPATLAYGNNQTGRAEKKGVVAAAMISFGACGGIAGKSFTSQFSRRYANISQAAQSSEHKTHHVTCLACGAQSLCSCCTFALHSACRSISRDKINLLMTLRHAVRSTSSRRRLASGTLHSWSRDRQYKIHTHA